MLPSEEEFLGMVDSYVRTFLGHEEENNIALGINIECSLYDDEENSVEKHKEFWKLIQDHEFLTGYLFQDYNFFPEIYGTCDSLYANEYARPLSENALLPFSFSVKERLTRAINILKYIELLEHKWIEPIHLCDVKHDHFGWTSDGRILFLDLDAVFTESALKKVMLNSPACESHEDCSFFDCQGYCQISTKTCITERTNTNLQVVCNKIFLGNSESSFITLAGLLVSSDIDDQVTEAVELCRTNKGMSTEAMSEVLEKSLGRLETKSSL